MTSHDRRGNVVAAGVVDMDEADVHVQRTPAENAYAGAQKFDGLTFTLCIFLNAFRGGSARVLANAVQTFLTRVHRDLEEAPSDVITEQ